MHRGATTLVLQSEPRFGDSNQDSAYVEIIEYHARRKAADRKDGGERYLLPDCRMDCAVDFER
jgi:hypothetical protein